MNNNIKKEDLNHEMRSSQAVLQYGTGAMIDFDDQTLMIAGPEFWEETQPINDERLEKSLEEDKIVYFRGFKPISGQEKPGKLAYVRFPEWYYCPKCHLFQTISRWEKQYKERPGAKIMKSGKAWSPYCFTCRLPLVPAPLVMVCKNGHIDDFPWEAWVHHKRKCTGEPVLEIITGVGFEGTTIKCRKCTAIANLAGSLLPQTFKDLYEKTEDYAFKCHGRHPWRNQKEACGEPPRAVLRSSSSVHFPTVVSSLVIPPFSSILTRQIEESRAYYELKIELKQQFDTYTELSKQLSGQLPADALNQLIANKIQQQTKSISDEIGIPEESIALVLKRKFLDEQTETVEATKSVFYRYQEYQALNGTDKAPNEEKSDFYRESTQIEDYNLPFVYRISLLHKLREVRVLRGFTRLSPANNLEDDGTVVVSVKHPNEEWYPAGEVRGEGIFIEFDLSAIKKWEKEHPIVVDRAAKLDENYKNSFFGKQHKRHITAKFLLLHTIAHLLIKELSYACGYNVASLQERIYCSTSEDGVEMQGILIYTASGDTEGTLGGLVRQGRPDAFPDIFRHAIHSALLCSNDPVCSLSSGQGRDSLNLSACHACSLIPETSCEINNIFLDRSAIAGNFHDRSFGFYSEVLNGTHPWACTCQNKEQTNKAPKDNKIVSNEAGVIVNGNKTSLSLTEFLNDLLAASGSEEESAFLGTLLHASLNGAEKPIENATLFFDGHRYLCPYVWENAKVILCDMDDNLYSSLKIPGWSIYLGNESVDVAEQLIRKLIEQE